MRKSLLILFMLVVGLTACGSNDNDVVVTEEPTVVVVVPTVEPTPEPTEDPNAWRDQCGKVIGRELPVYQKSYSKKTGELRTNKAGNMIFTEVISRLPCSGTYWRSGLFHRDRFYC